MSTVRHAKTCDSCKARGPEYDSSFAYACRECGGDFCEQCRDLLADTDADVDHMPDSLCVPCAVEMKAGAR